MNFKRALYYTNPVMIGDDVTHVQERLKSLGYYTGSIDGSFGPTSKKAVMDFQRTSSLEPDGSLGPITWNSLFSSNAEGNLNYTRALYYTTPVIIGDDVAYVQRRLKELGFYKVEIDGSFGPSLRQAVMDFQRANSLNVDGSVGPATWVKIFGNNINTSVEYKRPLFYTTPVMTGDDVTHIQKSLRSLGFYSSEIDGYFGPSLKQAVMDFQKLNELNIDGSVGPDTWNKLFNDTTIGQVSYKRALYYTVPIKTGDDVVKVQRKLSGLGFYKGAIDGSFGPGCDLATRDFQRVNGLNVDGSVGPATWEKLFSENVNSEIKYTRALYFTSPVITGNDVTHVQKRLKELSFYNSGIDGSFGPGLKQAVIDFQRSMGLSVDGSVGPATWDKLFNDIASTEVRYTRPIYYTTPIMTGNDVTHVQKKLEMLSFYGGVIDGSFGHGTKQAVMDFQRANKLSVDGSVGPTTWSILFGTSSSGGIGNLGNIKKVFIDAGHGGSDPGAGGNGLREKDITLSMALQLGNLLESKGISVNYSRKTDKYLSLENRASQANAWGADLFVSIHCNAFASSSANGTECFTYPSASSATKALSRNVSNSIAKSLNLTNRGHKEANFAVLRLTNMPAILIETAFITNASDASKLSSRKSDFVSSIASQILGSNIVLPNEQKELLRYASRNGLFKGVGIEVEGFNIKSYVKIISVIPAITLQLELSLATKFPSDSDYDVLDLSLTSESITTSFLDRIGSISADFPYKKDIKLSIDDFIISQDITKFVKYSADIKPTYVEVTFEVALPVGNEIVYQRFIYTIMRTRFNYSPALIPIPTQSNNNQEIDIDWYGIRGILIVGGLVAIIYMAAGPLAGVAASYKLIEYLP